MHIIILALNDGSKLGVGKIDRFFIEFKSKIPT